jgi:cytochrome P450
MRLLSDDATVKDTTSAHPSQCEFNPFEPGYVTDPYPLLAEFTRSKPVFYAEKIGYWVVTRYETVKSVQRDTHRFSNSIVSDPMKPMCPAARSIVEAADMVIPRMMADGDPPEHTRLRTFFSKPLNRTRIASLEPFTRESIHTCIDRMMKKGSPGDLVKDLTAEVPALVLFKLLGVPLEDVPKAQAWVEGRMAVGFGWPTDEEQVRVASGVTEFYRYVVDLLEKKTAAPGDDYLSDLIRLRNNDDSKVTLHELRALVFNLMFAGHTTTTAAASNLFKEVLTHRELWAALGRGEQEVGPVVEEGLRFDGSVLTTRRIAMEDVVLDGVSIPAGSRILLVFVAANRDPAEFDNPHAFHPERKNAMHHTTFATGIHFCMGAALARLELNLMLDILAKRLPDLTLIPDQQFEYTPNISFRSLKRLAVAW